MIFYGCETSHLGVHPQLLAHAAAGGAQRANGVRLIQVQVGLHMAGADLHYAQCLLCSNGPVYVQVGLGRGEVRS